MANLKLGPGHNLETGLGAAPILNSVRTRCISPENITGEKNMGGHESSPLGVSRKGSPSITLMGDCATMLGDIRGCGVIQRIWFSLPECEHVRANALRDIVLRIYWDDEKKPSVECPLGDFFCCGFARRTQINSLPIVVAPAGGFNCFFSMPFRRAARITVENQGERVEKFYYSIHYALLDLLPEDVGYFHAQWRRDNQTEKGMDYTVLDGVTGRGKFMGMYVAYMPLQRDWWGEGEVKFYIDDDTWPSICDGGLENYFGGRFLRQHHRMVEPALFMTPFMGYPFASMPVPVDEEEYAESLSGMHGMYRFHVYDPIAFDKNLRVTIQQIGSSEGTMFERCDDISTVAYWYQLEPHGTFPKLPAQTERVPR